MKQFPDRTLYPRDIVWNGDNSTGYHSSHLISTKMTYHHREELESKYSVYSAASHGKQARIWVIAHCVVQDGVIVREWLVRDNKRLYEQLGVCSSFVASRWAEQWLRDKLDPEKSKQCHLSWLAEEFQRVQYKQVIGESLVIDLSNIEPALRPGYQFVAGRIAKLYSEAWGTEGMTSREQFTKLVKKLYHPHALRVAPNMREWSSWVGGVENTVRYIRAG